MREAGGEQLVLLHGLGGSTAVWSPVIERLAAEREVLAIDLPGFGVAPSLPAGVEPSPVNLAAALREVCAARGFERPHVAGNSLGGWVALEVGRAGWAASVTAISPAGLWRKPLGERRVNPRLWARRLRPFISLALHTRRIRESMLATFSARPERIPAKEGRKLVLGWIDSSGYEGANRAMRTHVFDPRGYPDLPVTLAWGERDRLVAPPRPERRPAGSRYLVLPGVGHTPMWDDPELIAETLLEGSSVSAAV
ncbi:MAG TPA: alpha/beta fold hydrolase [Solirubrobacterales bacterium]